jgi:hypothetical protein
MLTLGGCALDVGKDNGINKVAVTVLTAQNLLSDLTGFVIRASPTTECCFAGGSIEVRSMLKVRRPCAPTSSASGLELDAVEVHIGPLLPLVAAAHIASRASTNGGGNRDMTNAARNRVWVASSCGPGGTGPGG